MPNYEKAIITITSTGENDKNFWIKDQNGDTYSAFKDWQGANTQVYNQFLFGNHNDKFTEGTVANISFKKTVGKDDKIYRNLASIFPASGVAQPQQTPLPVAPISSQGKSNDVSNDAFGRRLAIHGFVNALLSSGIPARNLTEVELKELLALEDRIDAVLTAKPTLREVVAQKAPQVVDPEWPTDEDVPFDPDIPW